VLHVAEELPNFPEWATRHFGTTSTAYFVLSHVPLFAAVIYIVYQASRPVAGALWLWLLIAVQFALVINAVFHVVTTIWFREYSPGVITGVLVYAPVALYLLPRGARLLGPLPTATACAAGAGVSALMVASLWMDITFV
jgi:hypothetical protein